RAPARLPRHVPAALALGPGAAGIRRFRESLRPGDADHPACVICDTTHSTGRSAPLWPVTKRWVMAKSGVLAEPGAAKKSPRSLGMWARLTGVLTAEQLQLAYAEWEKSGESPGEVFVRHGWMTEQMVADALGELSGLPVVSKPKRSNDPEVR